MTESIPMAQNTQRFRYLALGGYIGLLIWVVLWHFWLAPPLYSALLIMLFWVVPLLLPLKGLLAGKPYTHAWANFVIMLYLLHGLTALYTDEIWAYALIELIFATAMFVGCSFFARLRGRELGLGLKKLKSDS